jgi:hypothetical protein
VIVVTMENRTPDNLFSNMALVKELVAAGAPVNIQAGIGPQIGLESPTDTGHSYPELINEWDGGKLDGFANDPLTPRLPIRGCGSVRRPPWRGRVLRMPNVPRLARTGVVEIREHGLDFSGKSQTL